jgi:hypothetical protein
MNNSPRMRRERKGHRDKHLNLCALRVLSVSNEAQYIFEALSTAECRMMNLEPQKYKRDCDFEILHSAVRYSAVRFVYLLDLIAAKTRKILIPGFIKLLRPHRQSRWISLRISCMHFHGLGRASLNETLAGEGDYFICVSTA